MDRRHVSEITPDDLQWLESNYTYRVVEEGDRDIELYADSKNYYVFKNRGFMKYQVIPKGDALMLFCYLYELRMNQARNDNELPMNYQ